jgi:hypothetical protein
MLRSSLIIIIITSVTKEGASYPLLWPLPHPLVRNVNYSFNPSACITHDVYLTALKTLHKRQLGAGANFIMLLSQHFWNVMSPMGSHYWLWSYMQQTSWITNSLWNERNISEHEVFILRARRSSKTLTATCQTSSCFITKDLEFYINRWQRISDTRTRRSVTLVSVSKISWTASVV